MTRATVQDIDFAKVPELGDRLLDQLNVLRDADPIFWSNRHKSWIATGHAQVVEGLRGSLPLSVSGRLRRVFQVMPDQTGSASDAAPRCGPSPSCRAQCC